MRIPSLKLTANAPWNMTIGIDTHFLLGPGLFSGAIAVSFRECKICLNLIYDRSITSFHPIILYLWIYVQHCVLSGGALTNNSPSYSCCLFLRLRLKTLRRKMYRLRKFICWSQNCGTILHTYRITSSLSHATVPAPLLSDFLVFCFQKNKKVEGLFKRNNSKSVGRKFRFFPKDWGRIPGLKIPKASETWYTPKLLPKKTHISSHGLKNL